VIDLQTTGTAIHPRWKSVVGRRYRIHYSIDLVNWYYTGAEYEGTGLELTASVSKSFFAGGEHGFIRIEALGAP
jgi:hypothetical protein